jgi:hypothetical protein
MFQKETFRISKKRRSDNLTKAAAKYYKSTGLKESEIRIRTSEIVMNQREKAFIKRVCFRKRGASFNSV